MSDRYNHVQGISSRVQNMLEKCPDYESNPDECRIYGTCRCLTMANGSVSDELLVKWIGNCMRGEAYKRGKDWNDLADK